jgi:hypothetical protein
MPAVVIAKPDDEIVDLIDRVRSSADPDVGLVVPGSSRALQTPLNVRLLAQFSHQSGRRTSIVTEDPRLQQLARASGLPVYGSVPAFERGIELAGPRGGGSGAGRVVTAGAAGMAAAAVLEPPPAPPPAPPPLSPPAHAPATSRLEPRRVITQLPPAGRPPRGSDRRRFLYIAAAAIAIIGILLFMALAPSAKVTITIAATPLSVSSTIQGTTNPAAATAADHVLTGVVSTSASSQFTATPTGTKTLPAVAAKATLTFSTDAPSDISFTLPVNNPSSQVQSADQSVTFGPTRTSVICIGPQNPPPTSSNCGTSPYNATAPYVDLTAGANGNVGSGSLTLWQGDPCPNPLLCPGIHISVTNNSGASGGTDPKQVTAASATDVANWTSQVTTVEAQLSSQMQTELVAHAAGKPLAKDPAGNGQASAFVVTPQPFPPTVGAQFAAAQVTVKGVAEAAIYDNLAVHNDIIADLDKLVKPGDVLAKGSLTTPPCAVTQANVNGTVILACSATAFSQPQVNLNGLKAQLTGRNPSKAQAIVEGNVAKVQGVTVSEWPFKLFYLPLRASQIDIVENFVAPATKSP